MKTTSQITQEHKLFLSSVDEMPMNIYLEKANKKWYSEEELRIKLSDMYRHMCNEYGKANVWSMNAEELLENVDLLIEKKLFGEK